jgi:hypothetical protein
MPEDQKSRRPRFPFAWLGVSFVLILLFTFGPSLSLLFGAAVAGLLDCNVPISATDSCLFMGLDLSGPVITALLFGYSERAAHCLLLSKRTSNREAKLVLLDMARAWLLLAEQNRKNDQTVLVYEAPIGNKSA